MDKDGMGLPAYLLAISLVATVLLFTLRPGAGMQVALAGVALACAGCNFARALAAHRSGQRSTKGGDQRPVWLAWVLTPYAVWLFLAIGRNEVSGATVAAIGLVITASILVTGAVKAVRAANLAALTLVSASLVDALLDSRHVVSGSRDLLPIIYDGRAYGLLQHPNGLGQMSAMLFLLAWNRRSWVSFFISVVGLLAAASQTALLAVLLASCCLLGLRLFQATSSLNRLGFAMLGSALAMTFVWLLQTNVFSLPTFAVSHDDLTLTKRTEIWQNLSAGGVPSLGLGGDGLAARIAARTEVGSAHNMWFEAWLRDGIPGAVAILVALLVLVMVARRSVEPALALGSAALFVVEGMTESAPAHPIFFPMYVALIALAAPRHPEAANGCPDRLQGPRRPFVVAP